MNITDKQLDTLVDVVNEPGDGILKVNTSPVRKKFPLGKRATNVNVEVAPTVLGFGLAEIVVKVT